MSPLWWSHSVCVFTHPDRRWTLLKLLHKQTLKIDWAVAQVMEQVVHTLSLWRFDAWLFIVTCQWTPCGSGTAHTVTVHFIRYAQVILCDPILLLCYRLPNFVFSGETILMCFTSVKASSFPHLHWFVIARHDWCFPGQDSPHAAPSNSSYYSYVCVCAHTVSLSANLPVPVHRLFTHTGPDLSRLPHQHAQSWSSRLPVRECFPHHHNPVIVTQIVPRVWQ